MTSGERARLTIAVAILAAANDRAVRGLPVGGIAVTGRELAFDDNSDVYFVGTDRKPVRFAESYHDAKNKLRDRLDNRGLVDPWQLRTDDIRNTIAPILKGISGVALVISGTTPPPIDVIALGIAGEYALLAALTDTKGQTVDTKTQSTITDAYEVLNSDEARELIGALGTIGGNTSNAGNTGNAGNARGTPGYWRQTTEAVEGFDPMAKLQEALDYAAANPGKAAVVVVGSATAATLLAALAAKAIR